MLDNVFSAQISQMDPLAIAVAADHSWGLKVVQAKAKALVGLGNSGGIRTYRVEAYTGCRKFFRSSPVKKEKKERK